MEEVINALGYLTIDELKTLKSIIERKIQEKFVSSNRHFSLNGDMAQEFNDSFPGDEDDFNYLQP